MSSLSVYLGIEPYFPPLGSISTRHSFMTETMAKASPNNKHERRDRIVEIIRNGVQYIGDVAQEIGCSNSTAIEDVATLTRNGSIVSVIAPGTFKYRLEIAPYELKPGERLVDGNGRKSIAVTERFRETMKDGPCTISEIAQVHGSHVDSVRVAMMKLERRGLVKKDGKVFNPGCKGADIWHWIGD